jgi:hypothetical protein
MITKLLSISLYLSCLIIIILIILILTSIPHATSQKQEVFKTQSVLDEDNDWYDVYTGAKSSDGDPLWDIEELHYYLDGNKALHATLWLKNLANLSKNPVVPIEYGVQIDADSNLQTGNKGIEYDHAIAWDNHTKKWKIQYSEYSSYGDSRIIHQNYVNIDDFRKNNTINFVVNETYFNLSDKYRVFFYADGTKPHANATIDFLRWIYIPPPEFTISLNPEKIESIDLNHNQTVDITASSNIDIDTSVKLNPIQDRSLINTAFSNHNNTLAIPHNDRSMTTLELSLKNDTETQNSNLVIKGNFSLPKKAITPSVIAVGKEFFPKYDVKGSSVIQSVELPISIHKLPPAEPIEDQIYNSLERIKKITGPFNEIITGLAASGGVIFGVIYHEKIKKGVSDTKKKASNAGRNVKQKTKQAGKSVKDRAKKFKLNKKSSPDQK